MAKPVILRWKGEIASFIPSKLERSRIYGGRKRIAVDSTGALAVRASLTADGRMTIRSGMLAQGYFTPDGRKVERSAMSGLDTFGNPVDTKPSTLGVLQELEGPVEATELLGSEMQGVFFLTPEEVPIALREALKNGGIFRFPFNYSAGLETETAYLVANDEGAFALVCRTREIPWIDESTSFVPEAPDEAEEADDLDFDSL